MELLITLCYLELQFFFLCFEYIGTFIDFSFFPLLMYSPTSSFNHALHTRLPSSHPSAKGIDPSSRMDQMPIPSSSRTQENHSVGNFNDLEKLIETASADVILNSLYGEVNKAMGDYRTSLSLQKSNTERLLTWNDQTNSYLEKLAAVSGNSGMMSLVSRLAGDCGDAALSQTARYRDSGDVSRRVDILKELHKRIGDFDQGKSFTNWLMATLLMKAYVAETVNGLPEGIAPTETSVSGPSVPAPETSTPSDRTSRREAASEPHPNLLAMALLHEEALRKTVPPANSSNSLRRLALSYAGGEPFSGRGTRSEQDIRGSKAKSEPQEPSLISHGEREKVEYLITRINTLMNKIREGNAKTFSLSGRRASINLSRAFKDIKGVLDTYSADHTINTKQALRELILNELTAGNVLDDLASVDNELKNKYARLFQRIMHPSSLENGAHRRFRNKPYASVVAGLGANNRETIGEIRLISQEAATAILDKIRPYRANGSSLFFQDRIFEAIETHWNISADSRPLER